MIPFIMSTYDTFFDLTLRASDGIQGWDAAGLVWRMVHVAGASTKTPFAVAFPGWMSAGFTLGNTLRVFTQDSPAAEAIYDALEKAPRFGDFAQGGRVRHANGATVFEAYRMHRIPSGVRGEVNREARMEMQAQARLRRLAQQRHLPFVRMRTSSGKLFRLVIERVAVAGGEQGQPNGYGLSRASQIVALPVV